MTSVGVRRDRDARRCYAVSYDDRVTTSSVRPVVLRNGVGIEDPLRVVLGFLKAPGRFDVSDPSRPASFGGRTSGWRTGLVTVPAEELRHLGLQRGLHQQLRAEPGHLLQHLRQRAILGEQLINVVADTVSRRYSDRHGRGSFLR